MIGYWLCLAFVLAVAVAALVWAARMEDLVLQERARAAAFETQSKTLGEEKRQAEAQRDAFRRELDEERGSRAFWARPPLRAIKGGLPS